MESRARVCCLCEFPAADGGVHVADVDAEKWAKWCRQELGVEKIGGDEEAEHTLICQFCVWEARLVDKSSLDDSCGMNTTDGCDWWTGHDNDYFFRKYFYIRPLIQPCKVVLEKISVDGLGNYAVNDNFPRNNARLEAKMQVCQASPRMENQSNNLSPKATFKIFQCSLCLKSYQNRKSLGSHMSQTHKNAFRCKSLMCTKYFLNEDERQKHEDEFHLNGEFCKHVKCHFCGALLSRYNQTLKKHIKKQHKEAIKCDYKKNCPNFFHTESEKNDHIFNEHTQGLQLKITPIKCIYCDKISKSKYQLRTHVYKFHKDVGIKCRVHGCVVYFLSRKESDEHFLQAHQHAENFKKWQCSKCSYKSSFKHTLRRHLQNVHLNKANMKSIFKCPKSFIAKYKVKEHLKNIHGRRCSCQYCGKSMLKVSMIPHYLSGACKPDKINKLK